MIYFSLLDLKIFSLSLAFSIFPVMCLLVNLFVFILLTIHWASQMCKVFPQIWEIFSHFFFKYFFCFHYLLSFRHSDYTYVDALNVVPHFYEALVIFILFYLYSSTDIIPVDLSSSSLIFLLIVQICCWAYYGEFFISVILLCSRIPIWFFLIISTSYWYFLFDETLSSYLLYFKHGFL